MQFFERKKEKEECNFSLIAWNESCLFGIAVNALGRDCRLVITFLPKHIYYKKLLNEIKFLFIYLLFYLYHFGFQSPFFYSLPQIQQKTVQILLMTPSVLNLHHLTTILYTWQQWGPYKPEEWKLKRNST